MGNYFLDKQYTKRKSTETFSYLSKSSFVDAISDVGYGGEDNALVRGNVEILLAVSGNLNHFHYHYLLLGFKMFLAVSGNLNHFHRSLSLAGVKMFLAVSRNLNHCHNHSLYSSKGLEQILLAKSGNLYHYHYNRSLISS